MTLLAVDFPPVEFLIFAVGILIGLIGKVVELAKKVRERSIEAERTGEKQFGAELGEAPEPTHAEPPPRLGLFRRLPGPRREEEPLLRAAAPPPPPFTDPAGDAITVVNKVVSAQQPDKVKDDMIRSSPDEQKGETVVTSSFGCFKQLDFEMEYRIYDEAGNMSEPVTVAFSCPALKNRISPFLITGLILGVALLGAVGLILRHRHSKTARADHPDND